jgi:DNA polymerase III sliding clamp (beta) subunit (PCNA family)
MEQTVLMPEVAPAPPAKPTGDTPECTVSTRDLLKEMTLLQRVVARKTTVPILTHLHLQAAGNNLLLTATDGEISLRTVCQAGLKKDRAFTVPAHKFYEYLRLLAEGDMTLKPLENHWVQIRSGRSHTKMVGMSPQNFPKLPLCPKTLAELSSLLSATSGEQIQFAQDETTLYFAVGSRLLTSRQLSGKFPHYEGEASRAVLSRQELLLSLQRVSQFADARSNAVRLRIEQNELRLSSSSSEIGESEDVLQTNYAGAPKTMGFNSQYLLDFLRAVDCEMVCIEFKADQLPAELKPVDVTDKSFSYRYIFMPVKI